MIRAVVSIGTNSTRALVADVEGGSGRALLQRSTGTRIGEGLKESGQILEEPMERTLTAIREHVDAIAPYTSAMYAIATSAVRRAENASDFARRVREIVHADLRIVSGEDEAKYSFSGAVSGLDSTEENCRFGVADPGGGSTEYACGTKAGAGRIVSCETGAVRLTEALPVLSGNAGAISKADVDRARAMAFDATAEIGKFEHVDRLIFVGGTATSTVMLLNGSREPFEYGELSREDVERIGSQLRALDLERRKQLPAMNPQRADILPAGLILLDVLMERTGHDRATVSTNDLLMGFLLSR